MQKVIDFLYVRVGIVAYLFHEMDEKSKDLPILCSYWNHYIKRIVNI